MEATKKPVILFLMMQNPDIDHLVPIAVLLAETKKYTIKILTHKNHVNFQEDERIKYLKENYGIKVKAISDYYPISSKIPWLLYKWRSYWGIKCKNTKPLMVFGINIKSVMFPKFHIFRISRYFVDNILRLWLGGKKWGVDVMRNEAPSVVVIDHAFSTEWISSFINQVKIHGIPTISFPHSSFMFTHLDVLHTEKNKDIVPDHTETSFPWDYVVVESKFRVELLNKLGVDLSKMYPIGCIRYTRWWEDKLLDVYHNQHFDYKGNKPVVLFLASSANITLEEEINKLLDLMIEYSDKLKFIVKVHPRRSRTEQFKKLSKYGVSIVGEGLSSSCLINFSDYILVTASSVINSALIKKKRIIDVKFTMDNNTTFSKYGVIKAVESIDELKSVLNKIVSSDWTHTVDNKCIAEYLRECVHGMNEDEDKMIGQSLDFFSKILSVKSSPNIQYKIKSDREVLLKNLMAIK